MKKMDLTKKSSKDIALEFVNAVCDASESDLKKFCIGDVIDEDTGKISGKFRLIFMLSDDQSEYMTFTATFQDNTALTVYSLDKKETILDCTYSEDRKSWVANKFIPNVTISSLTDMAKKLRNVL